MDDSLEHAEILVALDEVVIYIVKFIKFLHHLYRLHVHRRVCVHHRMTYRMASRVPKQVQHLRRIIDISDVSCIMSDSKSPSSVSWKKTSAAKRIKLNADSDDRFFDMMSSFCDRADARLGDIASRIGFEHDASNARKTVYDALGNIPGLGMRDKLNAAQSLVNNTNNMDLFFSLPDDARAEMVKMILGGHV